MNYRNTEAEYNAACASDKPRFVFYAPDDFSVPKSILAADGHDSQTAQEQFRRRVLDERISARFDNPGLLGHDVVTALRNWRHKLHVVKSTIPAPGQLLFLDDFQSVHTSELHVVQGVRPQLHDLVDGCFMERSSLLENAIATIRETIRQLARPSGRQPVQIFWLSGPSGAGKSVLLLEIMRALVVRGDVRSRRTAPRIQGQTPSAF